MTQPATQNERGRNPGKSATPTTQANVNTQLVACDTDGEPRIDSRVLADHLGNSPQSVRELLECHSSDFEALGVFRFETGKPLRGSRGGRPERYALLNEDQCYLLLTYSRNTDRVRALKLRLVTTFRDARKRDAMPDLTDPNTLRTLLQSLAGQSLQLQQQIAVLEPKAQAFERIGGSDGSLCISDAAKSLNMQPKALFMWLSQHDWIYRRGATWIAYQTALDRGVMEHRVTTIHRDDGTEKATTQARVTAKGLALLATKLAEAA